ncbi:hypothetical protein SAMN05216370_0056 [Pseudomonas peli]|uniref:Uncharacterized protein n=1 Tax=Pseudomonas peli TaxID=592361 RepID=A0AB37ZD55_9PSED|nr:hypothetical protein [Pseudomonas peli]NMZ71412.1 hypothetical protein [Pseudomonas peli]SCW89613.1 hypothetical protein SAMN05216370_0056 [Pseudomonas peli]
MNNPALDTNQVRALHVLGQTLAQIRSIARSQAEPGERLASIAELADAIHNVPMTVAHPARYDSAELGNAIRAVAALHRKQGPAASAASLAVNVHLVEGEKQ